MRRDIIEAVTTYEFLCVLGVVAAVAALHWGITKLTELFKGR